MTDGLKSLHLPNGLELHVLERHAHPLVTSMVWYRVGSRDEGLGDTGLSHFLEHMMFKGSARFAKGEIDRLTASGGGSNNAFTSHDYTAYFFDFAADRWEQALEIEADRMRSCLLDPTEFEAEKQVVLEELAMGKDDPWNDVQDEVVAHAFVTHPYHHPIIGWADDLRAVDVARMRSWYERHYRPDNAIAVIVGDVDAERVVEAVQRTLGAIAAPEPRVVRRSVPAEPAQRGTRRVELERDSNVARLACAWRAVPWRAPERLALEALEVMLGSGRSSRLYEALVQGEELAATVDVEVDLRRDDGLFWAWIEVRDDADPVHAEEALLEQIEGFLSRPVSASELARAKSILKSELRDEQESVSGLAVRIGRLAALEALDELTGEEARIDALTVEAVEAAARLVLQPARRTLVLAPVGRDPEDHLDARAPSSLHLALPPLAWEEESTGGASTNGPLHEEVRS
ncbi:MAG: insulinase family protein [Planctomycetes bacterium]|nr:insulinase family protein [Planctomycetota bacterium]